MTWKPWITGSIQTNFFLMLVIPRLIFLQKQTRLYPIDSVKSLGIKIEENLTRLCQTDNGR